MNDFNKDLQIGRKGEQMVAAALRNRGHKVEDVSFNPSYQYKDIDFVLTDKSGRTTTLEVKNDLTSNYTNNVFIEMLNYNNVSRKYKGWYYYCEASFLCFVQSEKGTAHIVSHSDLDNLLNSKTYRTASSGAGDTKGLVVPLDDIKQLQSYIRLEV